MKRILLLVLVCFVYICAFVVACSTYNAVESEKLSNYPECVLAMNTYEAYKSVGEKSGIVLPSDACLKAIKRNRCIREIWNTKADDGYYMPDWSDEKGRGQFDSCMNRP